MVPAPMDTSSNEEDGGERRSSMWLAGMAGKRNRSLTTATSTLKQITNKSHAWCFILEDEIIESFGKAYILHKTK